MGRLLIFLSLVLFLFSCKRESLAPVLPTPPDYSKPLVNKDVSYGSQLLQKMDIDLPGGRTVESTKTIVVIHGGSWVEGDKADMTFVVDSIKKRNPAYAFVNLNYRLAINGASDVFPAQELDVKLAIEFYLAKSAEYNISKDIIVLGVSAGAQLALLHSYKNDPNKHVKAVVDFFGPTDLVAIWNEGLLLQFGLIIVTGSSYTSNPSIFLQSSPINFITPQSPPTIALQGGLDDLVFPEQSAMLINKLKTNGVANQLVYYPLEGHGFSDANNSDALNKILPFLSTYVK